MVSKRRLRDRKRKILRDLRHFRKMWMCMWKDEKRVKEFWEYVVHYAEGELEIL